MFETINQGIGFIEFLIGAGIFGVVLMLIFLAYSASRPADNPLRQVAGLLAQRVGITAAVGIVDIPATIVAPPAGGLMDVVSFIGLAVYWLYGFWQAGRAFLPPKPSAGAHPPTIVYMQPPPQGQTLTPMPPSYDRQTYHPAPPYPAE